MSVFMMARIAVTHFRTSTTLAALAALVLTTACPATPPIEGGESESETGAWIPPGDGEPGDGEPGDGDPGDGEPGDGEPGDGDPGNSGTLGECGDGVVNLGESCDDGNLVSGDGCASGCSIEGLIIPCGIKVWACGDGIDNDGDGKVDTDDVECISPCDDDEASFKTNIHGAGEDCKSDCYFDEDSGEGNDHCSWNLKCDPLNPGAQIGCEYDPDFAQCELEMPLDCLDACVPLVPNGCDCFGCCEIEGQFVYLDGSDGCALDNLDACESCTFYENCNNPCEPELCELCFGQDPSELPPECTGTGCEDPQDACDSSLDCEEGTFCQTGCCVPIAIP